MFQKIGIEYPPPHFKLQYETGSWVLIIQRANFILQFDVLPEEKRGPIQPEQSSHKQIQSTENHSQIEINQMEAVSPKMIDFNRGSRNQLIVIQ